MKWCEEGWKRAKMKVSQLQCSRDLGIKSRIDVSGNFKADQLLFLASRSRQSDIRRSLDLAISSSWSSVANRRSWTSTERRGWTSQNWRKGFDGASDILDSCISRSRFCSHNLKNSWHCLFIPLNPLPCLSTQIIWKPHQNGRTLRHGLLNSTSGVSQN